MSSYQVQQLKDWVSCEVNKRNAAKVIEAAEANQKAIIGRFHCDGEKNVVVEVDGINYYVHINQRAEKISMTPVTIVS